MYGIRVPFSVLTGLPAQICSKRRVLAVLPIYGYRTDNKKLREKKNYTGILYEVPRAT